ncbi:MAG TPA: succinate dehydrogenase [Nitrolancea sp.]|nr:succinate dehydrogenase [Nitrolancea sp.]
MVALPRVGRERPTGGNFELYSWYFLRVSGILLIFLAVVHVIIMHVIHQVSDIDFQFVANRWNSPFWRFFDWLLLTLALLHGLNGARIAIDDYIHARGWRIIALSALWSAAIIFLILGSVAIVTFNPANFNSVAGR